ncbi:HNH endonuclease family protein [Bifidobacterium adolescentis]|uniref:HNH endonuclease family protein n=1 Tax=Bifidobacterium adolescentis TaxID=1680 RepID=UPI0022E45719|nr:HNH endonuclease family protein [Bifidobacterium adolescentis]
MAGKGGKGGPWREFLDGMVVWILVCVCIVVLVSSGAWNVISDKVGIGHAASTSDLTKAPDEAQRRADAKSITDLLAGLTGHKDTTPKTDAGTTAAPKTDAKSDAGTKTDTRAATGSWGSDPAVWQAGLDATNTIATAKARPGGYDRERYFGGWASNGCGSATTRDTILARDLKDAVKNPRCQVTSGTLSDPYTGRTIQFRRGRNTSSAVQIDHVVALLDAWESGARDWDQAKRVQYANSPDVLLASDGPANMAKGSGLDVNGTALYCPQDSGAPDVWMPDNKAYRCDYMAKRATIKSKWGLTMTPREKQQTVSVLSQCLTSSPS